MSNKRFCDGNMTKIEKLGLLQDYFRTGNLLNAAVIEDKKKVMKPILPTFIFYSSFYLILGFGYATVLNLFVKAPKAYYIFPGLCCLGFGNYKFYEINEEKAVFVDKYEIEMFKKYCKKDRKQDKLE